MPSGLDDPSLMERQGTETAAAKAAAVADQAEFDLGDRRYTAPGIVGRMPGSFIR